MDFTLNANQERIRSAVSDPCRKFGDEYWLERGREGDFPSEFHAAVMMQTVAEPGAAMSGASSVHMDIFGLNPVVVFGTEEQRKLFARGSHSAHRAGQSANDPQFHCRARARPAEILLRA